MKFLKIPHQFAKDIMALYEPTAEAQEVLGDNMSPYDWLEQAVNSELYSDAVTFIAHGLPIRESIWWACNCASSRDDWSTEENDAINAAKAWVYTPDETSRRYAEEMAKIAKLDTGAGWAAQAAFWSGGSMTSPTDPIVPPPANLYAQAVAGCINLSAVLPDGAHAVERYKHYIEMGSDIANGGNGEQEGAL